MKFYFDHFQRQGCDGKGFYRPVYYEHNEQIEFEVHSSLEMPSLRFEIDDDDCDHEQTDGLSFAVPIGESSVSLFEISFNIR